jgi:hypothetical protein
LLTRNGPLKLVQAVTNLSLRTADVGRHDKVELAGRETPSPVTTPHSDSIDAGDANVYTPNPNQGSGPQMFKGPSLRGVWGAMGTIASGELQATD